MVKIVVPVEEAIVREKQIKGGSREAKEKLINLFNPEWKDLFVTEPGLSARER